MAGKDLCEETGELLLSQSEGDNLPDYAKEHIKCCKKCKEQQEKILKMRSLITGSKPECPEIRAVVLERIKNENIRIAQPEKKHHFPIGVMAAAAAVFAVYLSVYGSKLPEMVLNMNDAAYDAACDEEEIVPEAETESFYYSDKTMFKMAETPMNAQLSAAAGNNMKELNDVYTVDCYDDIAPDCGEVEEAAEAETALETEAVENEKTDAEMLFEKYSELYPDEISLEDIESLGWEIYGDFVMSVEDGIIGYTLEEFLNFAQ